MNEELLRQAIPWEGELERVDANPVLEPHPGNDWEVGATYNAAATYDEAADEVALVYRAEDIRPENDPDQNKYISRLGLATSDDGLNFTRVSDEPVLDIDGPYASEKTRGLKIPASHRSMTRTSLPIPPSMVITRTPNCSWQRPPIWSTGRSMDQ
jgi:hypothetical protein